jgi:mannitol PTS system EIIA component
MPIPIDANHILLGRQPANRDEAVRTIGDLMVSAGEVTGRYVEGMIEKEALHGTWITEGVALPHGTNEVKSEVRRSSVVVLQMPGGIDWGNGRTVYLAFGLAGKGDEHLGLLSGLAAVLQEEELVRKMIQTTDVRDVIAILTETRA